MASSGRDARRTVSARGGRARQSVVQAMRAANRGRGRQRSPAFEVRTTAPESSAASLKKLLRQARASGSLNLTSRSLEEVPEQVFNLIGEGAEWLCTTAVRCVERGGGRMLLCWPGVALRYRCGCIHHGTAAGCRCSTFVGLCCTW